MILEENMFVEEILPAMMLGDLSEVDHTEYRRPYLEQGESRRPTLTWPREIPFEGQPEDVAEIVTAFAGWLSESDVPKLLISGEPGALLVGPVLEYCRAWPNQNEVTVPGVHYLQEDSPNEIGEAIARRVEGLR